MASVEATGPTLDDAIDNALDELDLDEEDVDIEILSDGSNGEPARVRATSHPEIETEDEEAEDGDDAPDEGVPAAVPEIDVEHPSVEEGEGEWDEGLATAGREIVEDLLDYMGFPGEVDVMRAGHDNGTPTLTMAIVDGDSMGALIGRRGETLQAMQFISQLLINRRVGHWTRVLLDAEGYRSRRERYLKDAALRAAEKAVRFGEPIELDAMIPSERRVIHVTLADHEQVTTHSEGEGDNRRVIISPKAELMRARGSAPAERGRGGPGGPGGGGGFRRGPRAGGRGGGGGGGDGGHGGYGRR